MKLKHIVDHLVASGQRHVALAKTANELMDGEEEGSTLHTLCKAMVAFHTDEAQACANSAEALGTMGKTFGLADAFDQLVPLPEGFSRIGPDAPGRVTLVPRIGSAPVQKANVPEPFREAFSLGTEE